MRGARGDRIQLSQRLRIILADAGSTPICLRGSSCEEDHPRGCGEHPYLFERIIMRRGSFSRMRGALMTVIITLDGVRIILADAGSTSGLIADDSIIWDHPRGCGEHNVLASSSVIPVGSSSRMRGAQTEKWQTTIQVRIILADAGSTNLSPRFAGEWEDHPRGCGEHYMSPLTPMACEGSSSRMRGARTLSPRSM